MCRRAATMFGAMQAYPFATTSQLSQHWHMISFADTTKAILSVVGEHWWLKAHRTHFPQEDQWLGTTSCLVVPWQWWLCSLAISMIAQCSEFCRLLRSSPNLWLRNAVYTWARIQINGPGNDLVLQFFEWQYSLHKINWPTAPTKSRSKCHLDSMKRFILIHTIFFWIEPAIFLTYYCYYYSIIIIWPFNKHPNPMGFDHNSKFLG